jgi:hypothetical protein
MTARPHLMRERLHPVGIQTADFSTLWKKKFHTMEKSVPRPIPMEGRDT